MSPDAQGLLTDASYIRLCREPLTGELFEQVNFVSGGRTAIGANTRLRWSAARGTTPRGPFLLTA
jgi:hypothetical protein